MKGKIFLLLVLMLSLFCVTAFASTTYNLTYPDLLQDNNLRGIQFFDRTKQEDFLPGGDNLIIVEVNYDDDVSDQNEYVVLFNPTDRNITVDNTWSIEDQSSADPLCGPTTVQPYGFYLMADSGNSLPVTPDCTAATIGNALANTGDSIRITNSTHTLDQVCWEGGATWIEGECDSGATDAPIRRDTPFFWVDRGDNELDFINGGTKQLLANSTNASATIYAWWNNTDASWWKEANVTGCLNSTWEYVGGGNASVSNRSCARDFPEVTYLVTSVSGLDIIDGSDNSLWMRFSEGTDRLFQSSLYEKTDALNGEIYITSTGGSAGLRVIEFTRDHAHRHQAGGMSDWSTNISRRNDADGWGGASGDTLLDSNVNDVSATYYNYPHQIIAVATDAGISVINHTSYVISDDNAPGADSHIVEFTSNGDLIYNQDEDIMRYVGIPGADFSATNTTTIGGIPKDSSMSCSGTTDVCIFGMQDNATVFNISDNFEIIKQYQENPIGGDSEILATYIASDNETMYFGTATSGFTEINSTSDVALNIFNTTSPTPIAGILVYGLDGNYTYPFEDPRNDGNVLLVATTGGVTVIISEFDDAVPITPVLCPDGPVSTWNLSNNTEDSYGNNDGVLSGDTTYKNNGKVNSSATFDGTADMINVSDSSSLDFGTGDFTVCYWFNTTSTNTDVMVGKDENIGGNGWATGLKLTGGIPDDGKVSIWIDWDQALGTNTIQTTNAYNDGVWHHVCAGRDGTTLKLWMDGGDENVSGGNVAIDVDNGGDLIMGSLRSTYDYEGDIDEVYIYDRALNFTEVLDIYNNNNLGYSCPINSTVNDIPTQDTPILNSTLLTNTTNENLTLYYQNVQDQSGFAVTNITDWRIGGVSIALVNLPFDTNYSNHGVAEIIRDYSTYENNATAAAGASEPTWISNGVVGGAYYFDGGDHINITEDGDLGFGANDFAINLWFNSTGTCTGNDGTFYSDYDAGLGDLVLLTRDNCDNISFFVRGDGGNVNVVASSPSNNTWHMITAVRDGNDLSVYLNGVLDASNSGAIGNVVTADGREPYIGERNDGTQSFQGSIDEFIIFNRSLSANQIQKIYSAQSAGQSIDEIVSQETNEGETWSASVTPNDGLDDGITTSSNNLIIVGLENSLPTQDTPILNSTLGTNLTSENLTVYFVNVIDLDGHSVTNITDWRVNGISIAVLNAPFDTNYTNHSTPSIINDYSTQKNNGSFVTSPNWTNDCVIGGCYQFNDADNYINYGTDIESDLGNSFSVSAWINRATAGTYDGIVSQDSNGEGRIWSLHFLDDNRLEFRVDGLTPDATVYSGGTPLNDWIFVTATYDSTELSLYINGTKVSNNTVTGSPRNRDAAAPLHVGRFYDNLRVFDGKIDEVMVWNRSLSALQVQKIYQDYSNGQSVKTITLDETNEGETWSASVTPNDGLDDGITTSSNNLIIITPPAPENSLPTQDTPILNSTLGTNLTSEDLSVYFVNVADTDGDDVRNITDWRINGESLALINLPFETNYTNHSIEYIIRDYSTNEDNATTITSAVDWSFNDLTGGAYTFDGTLGNAWVNFSTPVHVNGDFTALLWLNFPSTPAGFMDVMPSLSYGVHYKDGKLGMFDGTFKSYSSGVTSNSWDMYVIVSNQSHWLFYLNGTLDATLANAKDDYNFMGIGQKDDENNPEYSIGHTMIFNKTLSPEQISQIYTDLTTHNTIKNIVSNETSVGEVWQVAVTPNDEIDDGLTTLSNSLTIFTPTFISNIDLLFAPEDDPNNYTNLFQKGEDFYIYVNWTDGTSDEALNDSIGECNISLINGITEADATNSNFTLCGTGCDYSIYTEAIDINSPSGAIMDAIHFNGCHEQLAQQDIEVYFNCTAGSYQETVLAGSMPICSSGSAFISVNSSVCISESIVNISLEYDGTNGRRKRITNLGLDRKYNVHVSNGTDVFFNDTIGLWRTTHAHEYYSHGEKTIFGNCSSTIYPTYNNNTKENITIGNIPPVIFIQELNYTLGLVMLQSNQNISYSDGQWEWITAVIDDDIDTIRYTFYNGSGSIVQENISSTPINIFTPNGTFYSQENSYNFTVWVNDTFSNVTTASILFDVVDYNVPPNATIITPVNGEMIVTFPYNITFNATDIFGDNLNVSLYLFNSSGYVGPLITNMSQNNNSYYWSGPSYEDTFQLTLEACEIDTVQLYCKNDTNSFIWSDIINLSIKAYHSDWIKLSFI